MKKFLHLLLPLAALASLATACSSKEPEAEPARPMTLLAVESSDGATQTYVYDRSDRIRQWICSDSDETIDCSYSYPDDKTINIEIRQSLRATGEERIFEEQALLTDGRITTINGNASYYTAGQPDFAAQYILDLTYDSFSQLYTIDRVQWSNNQTHLLRSSAKLRWKGGDIREYTRINGNGAETARTTYEYYDTEADESATVATPILIGTQYLPLQRAGHMGALPRRLVKTVTTEDLLAGSTVTDNYAYTFTVSGDRSFLNSYTILYDGYRSVTYTLDWDD